MVKYLECPDCGFVFKAPLMDIKFTHLGYNLPGLGLVKCPECKVEKRRKHYKQATEADLAKNTTLSKSGGKKSEPVSEKEMLEQSKYEDQ